MENTEEPADIDPDDEDALNISKSIVSAIAHGRDAHAQELIASIVSEVIRGLDEVPEEKLVGVVLQRCVRPAVIIGSMGQLLADLISSADKAGIAVDWSRVASPYDALLDLDDPFPDVEV